MPATLLSADQVAEAAASLSAEWDVDTARLVRTVEFPGFLMAVSFIDELAPIAEELDHHPDLRLSWRTVEITLSTHSAGGVTDLDVSLAGRLDEIISRLAAGG